MENKIVKTLIYDKQVRLYFVDNTKLINEILSQSKVTNRLLKLILGKSVSVVSLISGTLKGDQRISLQMTMSDPKYKVFADVDAKGNVRGYLNEELLKTSFDDINNVSLEYFIGHKGTIRVIKGSEMNQFTGITDMPYGNIVDDISHYFKQSEQTQTYIGANIELGNDNSLLFSKAIYAQLLPGAPIHLLDEVKHTINTNQEFFNRFVNFRANNSEKKLRKLFKDVKVIGYSPVQFFCGCSKEMFYGMLHSLSRDDLKQAINKKEPIDTVCQICGRTYSFGQSEIQELL
ncbi:molecular chaperone Hsp33 [Virgibacillus natechei]|uniref:Molecular chaperone Hsp33 n=1 Tax=Virgibacillus natechei TaxID=1216297 RepID=A0ABS4IBN7_9BACI|nr:Hsp33 family molecular chaperone HslO [Virgibacillus natechei]MBP1968354.1 molecular chaperone Hsp33 [Virgibacillus natechei]UZD13485.1 Hsp33 family molecular chaperone HslO [Virgibacillus natechei]